MQFLYPKFLWALFTLIVPIVFHLFNFRKYTTVYFSNVTFLKSIKKESKSRSNLKNLLILLSRMLALAFLVMVFAQPYIPNKKNFKVAEVPYVTIYIDNSFSMEAEGKYGILLESAKVNAKEITSLFSPNAKYLLVTNEFMQLHQRFVSSEQLIEWIAQVKSTHIVRSQNEVLTKVSGLLPNNDTNVMHSVFIMSDFQRNTISNSKFELSNNIKLFAVPFLNQTESNLFIDSVWFETPGHYKGKQEILHIKIKNITDEPFVEIPLQLFINDTLKTSVLFNINEQSAKELTVPFTLWSSGSFKASVNISDYPITFDNILYFNFTIANKKNALIISDNSSQNYFEALYKNDENIQSTSVNDNDVPYSKFSSYQVIILNEVINISSGLTNQIVEYINNGGTFVFVPHKEGNIKAYNELLKKLGSVNIENYVEQQGSITNVDLQNIVFKSVFNDGLKDVRLPEYNGFYKLNIQQKSNVNTIFKSESGSALFIQSNLGKGQYYVSGLSINREITDFGTHPIFVPLFYNIALFSSLPTDLYYWVKPGVFSKVTRKNTNIESFSLLENSTNKELKPKHHITMQSISIYPEVNELSSGHYSAYLGDKFQDYVSFNFDRRESVLTYYSTGEIDELYNDLSNADVYIIKPNSNKMATTIKQQSNGKSLSTLFLWFTLLFFVSEMLLLRFLR